MHELDSAINDNVRTGKRHMFIQTGRKYMTTGVSLEVPNTGPCTTSDLCTMDLRRAITSWARLLGTLVSSITVEPALLIFMIASYMEYGVYQDLLYQKLCLRHYHHDKSVCDDLQGDQLDYVQEQASYWLQYNNLCLLVPSIVSACYLGSWGDRYGKKLVMLSSCFSTLLGYLIFLIISVYEDSPVELTLVANFVSGLGGGYLLIVAAAMSYVADITTKETRTSRVAMLESMTFLGSTFGPLISGYLLDGVGYAYTFLFCVACNTVVILYLVVRVRNRIPKQSSRHRPSGASPDSGLQAKGVEEEAVVGRQPSRGCTCNYLYEGVMSCFKQRRGRLRMYIGFVMASCLFVFFASDAESDLTYLYVKDDPLNWSYKTYSQYSTMKSGLAGFMLLVGLPVARHYLALPDTTVVLVGLVSRAAGLLLLSFSTNTVMMFFVPVAALFSSYPIPCYRAMLSKLVEEDEQGKISSALATVENLVTMVASVMYNNMYPATRPFLHGFCFLVATAFLVVPATLTSYVHWSLRSTSETSRVASPEVAAASAPIEE